MHEPFVVDKLTVQAGSKQRQFVTVAARPGGAPIGFPLLVAHGAKPGPVFCAVSGVHGDEYEGREAIRRVFERLDAQALGGTFLAVPTANVPAFENSSRSSPVDQVNLARVFPGKPDGTVSERVAHKLFHDVAMKSDLLIDFHGGGVDLWHASLVNFPQGENQETNKAVYELARATGMELMVQARVAGGMLPNELVGRGKVAVNIEVGGQGHLQEALILQDVEAIWNAMRAYRMVDGELQRPPQRLIVRSRTILNCNLAGMFVRNPEAQLRTWVPEGYTLGWVRDIFGDVVETIVTPHRSYVTVLRSNPTVLAGNWVAFLGREVETVEG